MSFSFSAGGTRAETIASLSGFTSMSGDGERTRQLVLSFLENAADGTPEQPLRYDVTASGHHAGGALPFLNVTLTCSWPKPAEPGLVAGLG